VNSKEKPTCFTNQTECLAKKQQPGDYDYLLLDQFYVPQFCRDLLRGIDSTVSHQNVNPFPKGIRCNDAVVKNQLTIHGLWPNYNDGYPACCNVTENILNKPFHAADFATHQSELLEELSNLWIDPTQGNSYDTLCEIYNHEFQKHGICYAADGTDYMKSAIRYFNVTLSVAKTLSSQSKEIDTWAADQPPQIPSLDELKALYSKNIQILCTVGGENYLSAIRTCHKKMNEKDADDFTVELVDCPIFKPYGNFVLCDATRPISLAGYVPPASECADQSIE
jgi:ribonuclease T2